MAHKVFLVAKGFSLAKHYNTLGAFITKESRITKVRDLKPDRCLEFMTDDDHSVEFLCRDTVIYARPSTETEGAANLEMIFRNIKTYGQLTVIAGLISNNKAADFIETARNIEKGYYTTYSMTLNKEIKVHVKVENNGNTFIFDGEKL